MCVQTLGTFLDFIGHDCTVIPLLVVPRWVCDIDLGIKLCIQNMRDTPVQDHQARSRVACDMTGSRIYLACRLL